MPRTRKNGTEAEVLEMKQDEYKAKLVGYVLEGELDVRAIDGVTHENYMDLFCYGRNLWNMGKATRYVIAIVVDEDGDGNWRSVGHVRPDRGNFGDPAQFRYIVDLWKRERSLDGVANGFGGKGWMAFHDKLFAEEYGFSIGSV